MDAMITRVIRASDSRTVSTTKARVRSSDSAMSVFVRSSDSAMRRMVRSSDSAMSPRVRSSDSATSVRTSETTARCTPSISSVRARPNQSRSRSSDCSRSPSVAGVSGGGRRAGGTMFNGSLRSGG